MSSTRKWVLLSAAILALRCTAATDAQCTELLQRALEAKNPETRQQAVIALSLAAVQGPLMKELVGMLDDKDVQVRLAVVTGLAELKTEAATAALRHALEDDAPEVTFAAAQALWTLHDPAGKTALLAVLAGETKSSSSFLTKQKREALRMLHTPRTTFLYAVNQGTGFIPLPGVGTGVSSMEALLTNPLVSGRATAALMLGKDADEATVAALKDALYDKNWGVRAAAVHSLALRNDVSFKKDLALMLEDDKEQVRLRAAAAYLRLSAIQANTARAKRRAEADRAVR
jgi:HEAT repeat protein